MNHLRAVTAFSRVADVSTIFITNVDDCCLLSIAPSSACQYLEIETLPLHSAYSVAKRAKSGIDDDFTGDFLIEDMLYQLM